MRKYEFTGEVKRNEFGIELHRIQAVAKFGTVKPGDFGGWIEKEENLSHERNAWIDENAEVFGTARIKGNAWVGGNAKVFENAWVGGYAIVKGNARVYGNSWIIDNAMVYGNTKVFGEAQVGKDAFLSKTNHCLVISPFGDEDNVTFYRNKDGGITVNCSKFFGGINKFLENVTAAYRDLEYAAVYRAAAELAKLQIVDLKSEGEGENEGITSN